ncbi:MAG: YihY/virulence factor BrkB family protein [Lachnospiraceae bacterium]
MEKVISSIRYFLRKCKSDNIDAFAAQSAYFIISSAIPFLLILVTILQYTLITQETLLHLVQITFPDYFSDLIEGIIDEIYSRSAGVLSLTVVLAIWTAAKGFQYMASGLNAVNDIKETRNWIILRLWSTVYTFLFEAALIFILILIIFGNKLGAYLSAHFSWTEGFFGQVFHLRYLIMVVVLVVFFTILYEFLPNHKKELKRRKILKQLPGALICALSWFGFSFGLSVYVNYFHGFSMYGSLTTIVLVMIWLYICMYIFLMCAEFNVIYSYTLIESIEEYIKRKKKH